jgi:hypothetical protein
MASRLRETLGTHRMTEELVDSRMLSQGASAVDERRPRFSWAASLIIQPLSLGLCGDLGGCDFAGYQGNRGYVACATVDGLASAATLFGNQS